jgi:ATP-dependent helicase/nuclease subunit B
LDAWLRRVWEERSYTNSLDLPVLLDSAQEEALWEEEIRTARSDDPLLNIPPTAAAALNAWELLNKWEAPRHAKDFEGLEDNEAFFGWMTSVERKLRSHGWITSSELYLAVKNELAAGAISKPSHIAFAGFDDASPAERNLLEALGASALDTREFRPPRDRVPARPPWRVTLHDATAELEHAASWARNQLQQHPDARIGVAAHGLRSVSSIAERIFDDIFHLTYSFEIPNTRPAFEMPYGAAADEAPLIAAALLILKLVDGLTLPEAGVLLRSPFLPLRPEARVKLDGALRDQGIDRVSIRLATLSHEFEALGHRARKLPSRQRPAEWSASFSDLLKAAGWPGPRELSAGQRNALDHWKDLLSSFARLDAVLPELSFSQALVRLRRLASRSRIRQNQIDAPVQIMDAVEASDLCFDALWVMGLDAGSWPRPVQPNPFLPVRLQRAHGMPRSSPEMEFHYARRVTRRLMLAASEVVFSSAEFLRDEPLRVSPLIEQIERKQPHEVYERARERAFVSSTPLEEIPLGNAPALPRGTLYHGGARLLEHQAACPFRAFAIYRLGAGEIGDPPLGVSPREHGSAVHDALETIWKELGSQEQLVRRSPEDIDALVGKSVDEALDKRFASRMKSTGILRFRELEKARLQRLIKDWLSEERKRQPFKMVAAEAKGEVAIGGMRLNVRVDRIDEYDDGRRAIIDYKTSDDLTPRMWDGDRPDAPQLPLYAVTHEREVGEIAFGKIVSGAQRLISAACDAEQLTEWRRVLESLADQYLNGHAAVDPKRNSTCGFCKLGSLCRVAEVKWEADDE